MTSWVTPTNWTNGAIVEAQMDGISANLNHLYGAFQVLTGSTTADTGTTMFLDVTRTSASDPVLRGRQSADVSPRVELSGAGQVSWGSGSSAVDASIRRTAAKTVRGSDTAIGSDRALSTDAALQALVTGDSVVRWAALASGAQQWSTGAATADVQLSRGAAGRLLIDSNGTANTAAVRLSAEAGQQANFDILVSGDTVVRTRIKGDATLNGIEWSSGAASADTNLYRSGANHLTSDDKFRPAWWKSPIKAGVPSDADVVGTAESGDGPIIDTTNSRAYWRVGATWKFTALT